MWLAALLLATPVAAQTPNSLRIGVSADLASADPHFQSTSPNNALWRHIYEPLVGLSPTGYFQKAAWALRKGLTMPPHPAEYTLATTIHAE
jgi:hypothetical protein